MAETMKTMLEQFQTLDNSMSLEKIIRAKESKEPVIGKVVMWHSTSNFFEVDLGNGLHGILPLSNSSIYPSLSSEGKLSAALRYIMGKHIAVIITSVNNANSTSPIITLSRKELMLNAFNSISNSIGKEVECCVTSFSTFGVFVDVGNGISGLIYYKQLCLPRVESFSDVGISIGDKITATILDVDEKNFHVNLNYKDQFENLVTTLEEGDLIIVKALKPHNDDAYFVFANANTSALMDTPPNLDINYGDNVVARVKGPRPNNPEQLRLTFVSLA